VNIRRALAADADAIAALATELGYPTTPEEIRERLRFLLPLPSQFVAVAEAAEGILGWVAAEERVLLESGRRAEIVGLVVGATVRRHGIGSALVRAAESWAQERGLGSIVVRSNVLRSEAHAFYARLGYEHRKTQHAYARKFAARDDA
jgi:ribosomal protein S18 acetylase RimI-like enzyme